MTDTLMAAFTALIREPMALVMGFLSAALTIAGLCVRGPDRLLLTSFVVISGLCAWIIATSWRWAK